MISELYIYHVCLLCGTLSLIVALRPLLFSEEIHPFEAKCWMSADSQVLHKSLRIQRPSELKTDPFEIVFDGHMCHMYSNGQKFIKILHKLGAINPFP
jgi:hypothetical protein